jgi:hypothetical protein
MLTAGLIVSKEVLVLGDDDAILSQREGKLFDVGRADEINIGRCGDIHSPQAKPLLDS